MKGCVRAFKDFTPGKFQSLTNAVLKGIKYLADWYYYTVLFLQAGVVLKGQHYLLSFWLQEMKIGLLLAYFPGLCKILSSVSIVLKNNKVPGGVYGRLARWVHRSYNSCIVSSKGPWYNPTVQLCNTCTALYGKQHLKKVSWCNFKDKSWSALTVEMCFLQLLSANLFCGGNRNWSGRILPL